MSRYASREAQEAEQSMRDVQGRLEGNNYCADCGHPRPEYINLTIGTFICLVCTEIHRSMSNRRIKDVYGGELTFDDVRRMDSVGNDVANRKFLATWNPREVPEPDRRDKEMLREFIWLKYDGSFKKKPQQQPALPPPPPAPQIRDYRPDDRYYDDRVPVDRSREYDRERVGYRREQELFREAPQQSPERARSYWTTRYESTRQPQPPPPRPRDDYYAQGPSPGPVYPDRYRSASASMDRFQPPQPRSVVPYGRVVRNARARYQDQGMAYEDYASLTSEDREDARRKISTSRSRRKVSPGPDGQGYSDGELELERSYRKTKSSKDKDKLRRRKTAVESHGNSYYSDEDEEDAHEVRVRRGKKTDGKKSKKSAKESKSKKRVQEEDDEEYDEDEEDYDDEQEEEEVESTGRKPRKQSSRKSDRRNEKDRDSVVTTSVDGLDVTGAAGSTTGQPAKAEFDLMSEWMGDSKDTDASSGTANAQNVGSPSGGPIPSAMQQAYATQVPMMAPPMSVYGGMMPMPGGGFMPMMTPGFVPGMGIPGMPPGMPPPGMPPMAGAVPPGMSMAGGPGAPPGGIPPMQGMMNGMQNLNLGQPAPQGANAQQPPPPPPVGMPAGPAPGPPQEPPS